MPSLTTDLQLKQAVAALGRRTPAGVALSSREWELVPAEIRLRSMFSAQVANELLLQEMKERLAQRLALAKPADGSHMDRGLFIEEMRKNLSDIGYKRGDAPRGSLKDMKSSRRLGLIWDMNLAQANGYARWKSDMTPEGLDNEPCYELIRLKQRIEIRDWPLVWANHGGKFYGRPGPAYPTAKGRMLAKKTDGIWIAISRFGTPWPPFDWGSGMGLLGVDRAESEALNVIAEGEELIPLDTPFNEGAQASLVGIPQDRRQAIADALLGDVEIDGDTIRILPAPRPATFALPAIPPEARTAAQSLSAADSAKLLQAAGNTVAVQRLTAAARDAGESLSDAETIARAIAQYLAIGIGAAASYDAIRTSDMRDALWSRADFAGIESILTDLLPGGAA